MLDQAFELARWDNTLQAWKAWAARLPESDTGGKIGGLWSRVEPRLSELAPNLDRVLVVGLLGGTGTGKSTLGNAIVGARVCAAGDVERPTTKQPAVVHHPTVDASFLPLTAWDARTIARDLPLLEHLILIDCPDPDTQGSDSAANTNRDRLRAILPQCDVIIVTGTAQKYKTERVWGELLSFATGRAIIFVQTHAEYDPDIRDDWRHVLEGQGFAQPTLLRLDSEQALRAIEQRLPLPPEYRELRELLERELHTRGRKRLRRANALNLWADFARAAEQELSANWAQVERLDAAMDRESARLLKTARDNLQVQLRGEKVAWRKRLLGECSERWGLGPFGAWLRATASLWSWLRWVPVLRARTLGSLVVTGAYTAGSTLLESWNHAAEQRGNVPQSAALGWTIGEIAQTQVIIAGFVRQAGLMVPEALQLQQEKARLDRLGVMLAATQARLSADLDRRASEQAARRTRWYRQLPYELLFTGLIAILLARWGYDFFYRYLYLWEGAAPTGWDVVLQGLLWIAVLGWLLRSALAASLGRGWQKIANEVVEQLDGSELGNPFFHEVGERIKALEASRREFNRLHADLMRWNEEQESDAPSQLTRRTSTPSGAAGATP